MIKKLLLLIPTTYNKENVFWGDVEENISEIQNLIPSSM